MRASTMRVAERRRAPCWALGWASRVVPRRGTHAGWQWPARRRWRRRSAAGATQAALRRLRVRSRLGVRGRRATVRKKGRGAWGVAEGPWAARRSSPRAPAAAATMIDANHTIGCGPSAASRLGLAYRKGTENST